MKAYVDTNVLVAASIQEDHHHVQAFDLVKKAKEGVLQGCIRARLHAQRERFSGVSPDGFSTQNRRSLNVSGRR